MRSSELSTGSVRLYMIIAKLSFTVSIWSSHQRLLLKIWEFLFCVDFGLSCKDFGSESIDIGIFENKDVRLFEPNLSDDFCSY